MKRIFFTMENYTKNIEIRWADLDPNFHVLHSKYYDFAAYSRIAFLSEMGLTMQALQELQIGPVLFREECTFKREIQFGDVVKVNFQLVSVSADFGRWTIQHQIWKNETTLAATIVVDGAWINIVKRKLAAAPEKVKMVFEQAPKTENFKVL